MVDEKMQTVLKKLETGVQEFFTSERFLTYLSVMGRFHNYSLNNQILIASQMPEARLVAGFKSWQKNFDRHVKKGERAITILAPSKFTVDVETDKADEYGNAVVEKREVLRFRPVSVFDVSQTEGKELPSLVEELTGDVDGYSRLLAAVTKSSSFPVSFRDIPEPGPKGYCDFGKNEIVIKSGMSEVQTIKTAIHECTHARLHRNVKEKETKEVEAESTAYVVCSHFGIDTSDYSFGYVAAWASHKDTDVLKDSMQTIRDAASAVITEIEKTLRQPEQEKSLETREKSGQAEEHSESGESAATYRPGKKRDAGREM